MPQRLTSLTTESLNPVVSSLSVAEVGCLAKGMKRKMEFSDTCAAPRDPEDVRRILMDTTFTSVLHDQYLALFSNTLTLSPNLHP